MKSSASTGRRDRASRLVVLVVAFLAVTAVYAFIARPWFLRWGASEAELRLALPGDGLVPGTHEQLTRAVTINAPADAVWPWLAQIGQDRAGFYSYEVLEDLAGCEMPRADRILPEHQQRKVGDTLWMMPSHKFEGRGSARLLAMIPDRLLAWGTSWQGMPPGADPDSMWNWVLEPIDARRTRFIVRGHGVAPKTLLSLAFVRGFFEPAHFVMERRMMLAVRDLAEGRSISWIADTIQVLLWTITALLVLIASLLVFRRERWRRPLAIAIGAGLLFQFLTFVQPPLILGGVLVMGLLIELWRPERHAPALAAGRA